MERMFKKFLSLAMLFSFGLAMADCNSNCNNDCNNDCNTTCPSTSALTCILPRSTSKNLVIKTAGLDPDHEYLFDTCNFNWDLAFALEYQQTFDNCDLAECMFGPAGDVFTTTPTTGSNVLSCRRDCGDCDNFVIRIKGTGAASGAPNGTTNLVAENFFLPSEFESTVSFSPSIKNINFHIQFYAGLDEWAEGLFFRLYAPVTHTRWDLEACETIIAPGTPGVGAEAGAIAPIDVPTSALQTSFLSFARGNTITISPDITVQGLQFSRIPCDTLTETKLADLRAEFGWNFCLNEDYHVGFYIEAAAPTGSECCPIFLFSPMVGNGHFWELGAGLTAHYTLWRCEDGGSQFDFYIEGDVTHLFQHSELRTFDLRGKPLSRFMMAEQLTTTTTDLSVAAGTTPETFVPAAVQFNNVFAPVANITTQNVDVSIAAHGEVLAKFIYTCGGFSWELGYNFYGRSCEDIELDCDCVVFDNRRWALRGDAQVFGFINTGEGGTSTPVALGAVRSTANVFSPSGGGTANVALTPGVLNNTQITNPVLAFAPDGTPIRATSDPADVTSTINTSALTPTNIFITLNDIDFAGQQSRMLTHKVFTHFNYTWIECEDWIPFIGIGASAEFGQNGHNDDCCPTTNVNTTPTTPTTSSSVFCGNSSCDNDCNDSCVDCSPSQWAVWIKGGLSFN